MSNLDECKFGTFLCSSLVLVVVYCFEGSLNGSARFWERRGFRVVIIAEVPAEVLAVLCVQWCLRLKRDALRVVAASSCMMWACLVSKRKMQSRFCLKKKKRLSKDARVGEVTPLQEEYGHFHG